MTSTNHSDSPEEAGLHLGWFLSTLAAGVVVTASAFFVPASWPKASVWENVAVGVGSALGLVGVLNFFAQKMNTKVAAAAEQAARNVERRLGRRVSELAEQINRRERSQTAEQDRTVDDIEEEFTAYNVAKALHQANGFNAIDGGRITVPIGVGTRHLRMSLSWLAEEHRANDYEHGITTTYSDPKLYVRIGDAAVEWHADQDFTDVAVELKRLLARTESWNGQPIDWELGVHNLRYVLRTAMDAKRRRSGALSFHGTIREMFSKDVYFTSRGLESPIHETVIEADFFGHPFFNRKAPDQIEERRAQRPAFVTEGEWEYILELCPGFKTHSESTYPRPGLVPWGAHPENEHFTFGADQDNDAS